MSTPTDVSGISDDYMHSLMQQSVPFTIVVLTKTERYANEGSDLVIWEHGRRNFALRADGRLAIVCPVRDDSAVSGIGIFTTDAAETAAIMDGDPAVRAGIFHYAIHPTRTFAGDSLPG
ncbi:MAG: hypothetical protein JWQ39_108 [Glaciihabitans sp.]|jgi:hypothetical protein|nr:hypothetical protein [Glaciihabitans sp.]